MNPRRYGAFALVLALAGCGGASATGGGGKAGGGGSAVVTAGGTEVSQEAHNKWTAALETFRKYEQQGWNKGRCDEVIGQFDDAVSAQKGNKFAEAVYMSGVVAERCGRDKDALEFYNRALEMNPKLCKARTAIGVNHLEEGRAQPAMTAFQQALRDDPQCTEAYLNIAVVQRQRLVTARTPKDTAVGQLNEALNNLRRALAIESDYLPAFNQMALLYLQWAEASGEKERLNLAEIVCRQAQLIRRNYAPLYNTWGLVKVQKGDIIEALRMFERASQLNRNMFEAYMNFGQVTLSFRGYQDSRNAFARAVELRPRSYDADIGLGAAQRGLGQMQAAQAEYEKAMQLDANRPEAYFNLGVLYQDYMAGNVQDLQKAKGYFNQFLGKTGGGYSDAVEEVRRTCQREGDQGRRRKRRAKSTDCRPGRMQNIDTAMDALRAAAQMQQKN